MVVLCCVWAILALDQDREARNLFYLMSPEVRRLPQAPPEFQRPAFAATNSMQVRKGGLWSAYQVSSMTCSARVWCSGGGGGGDDDDGDGGGDDGGGVVLQSGAGRSARHTPGTGTGTLRTSTRWGGDDDDDVDDNDDDDEEEEEEEGGKKRSNTVSSLPAPSSCIGQLTAPCLSVPARSSRQVAGGTLLSKTGSRNSMASSMASSRKDSEAPPSPTRPRSATATATATGLEQSVLQHQRAIGRGWSLGKTLGMADPCIICLVFSVCVRPVYVSMLYLGAAWACRGPRPLRRSRPRGSGRVPSAAPPHVSQATRDRLATSHSRAQGAVTGHQLDHLASPTALVM
jgi:hypothetical protein